MASGDHDQRRAHEPWVILQCSSSPRGILCVGRKVSWIVRSDRSRNPAVDVRWLATEGGGMKIRTAFVLTPLSDRSYEWVAVDDDVYGGPPDKVGIGATEAGARADLIGLMLDD